MGRLTERYFRQTSEGRNDIIRDTLPKDLGAISLSGATATVFSSIFEAPELVTRAGLSATLVTGGLAATVEVMRRWQAPSKGIQEINREIRSNAK